MLEEKYTDFWKEGDYVCAKCGKLLFSSNSKFKSGTMWPSFRDTHSGAISMKPDYSLGMERTEILCGSCENHLGHVFDDGVVSGDEHPEAGKRYCVLSDSLEFKKNEE